MTPKAPFKTLIVSAPALQKGQTLTVWQKGAAVCQRKIDGSLMQFPVTQRAKTQPSKHSTISAAATESPAKAALSGSMTAHPAASGWVILYGLIGAACMLGSAACGKGKKGRWVGADTVKEVQTMLKAIGSPHRRPRKTL